MKKNKFSLLIVLWVASLGAPDIALSEVKLTLDDLLNNPATQELYTQLIRKQKELQKLKKSIHDKKNEERKFLEEVHGSFGSIEELKTYLDSKLIDYYTFLKLKDASITFIETQLRAQMESLYAAIGSLREQMRKSKISKLQALYSTLTSKEDTYYGVKKEYDNLLAQYPELKLYIEYKAIKDTITKMEADAQAFEPELDRLSSELANAILLTDSAMKAAFERVQKHLGEKLGSEYSKDLLKSPRVTDLELKELLQKIAPSEGALETLEVSEKIKPHKEYIAPRATDLNVPRLDPNQP